ncbi:MAG: tetratricopeptide repeat protein [Alphaproteobacteria bacterium]|nr:tetratricopeptide repeat protein [Alphaproteobacteria bacterium]
MRSVRDQLLMVEELRQAGAREQALALCRDLVREAPRNPDPLRAAAQIALEAGRPQLALPMLERAAALAPHRADLHCDLAALLRDLGEDAGAEETFAKAVAADPACQAAQLALAEIYEAQGRVGDAIRHLDMLVGLNPAALQPRTRLALLLAASGEEERAAEITRETMRYAETALAESYRRIRSQGPGTPADEKDVERLAWSYALLSGALAGADIARFEERRGEIGAALRSYRRVLGVLIGEA